MSRDQISFSPINCQGSVLTLCGGDPESAFKNTSIQYNVNCLGCILEKISNFQFRVIFIKRTRYLIVIGLKLVLGISL